MPYGRLARGGSIEAAEIQTCSPTVLAADGESVWYFVRVFGVVAQKYEISRPSDTESKDANLVFLSCDPILFRVDLAVAFSLEEVVDRSS